MNGNETTRNQREGQGDSAQQNTANIARSEKEAQPFSHTHEGSEATQTESERAQQQEDDTTPRTGNSSI